jgi:hypothetical protein
LIGAGFVLDYNIETQETTIHGIDGVLPSELAPSKIEVTMNIQVYRTPDNDPVDGRIAPLGDRGNDSSQKDFQVTPYISIEIRDRTSDKTVLFLPRAWVLSRSGSAQAEGILTETWRIKSIGYIGAGGQQSGLIGSLTSAFGAAKNLFSAF